jgi:hypothetical protein
LLLLIFVLPVCRALVYALLVNVMVEWRMRWPDPETRGSENRPWSTRLDAQKRASLDRQRNCRSAMQGPIGNLQLAGSVCRRVCQRDRRRVAPPKLWKPQMSRFRIRRRTDAPFPATAQLSRRPRLRDCPSPKHPPLSPTTRPREDQADYHGL